MKSLVSCFFSSLLHGRREDYGGRVRRWLPFFDDHYFLFLTRILPFIPVFQDKKCILGDWLCLSVCLIEIVVSFSAPRHRDNFWGIGGEVSSFQGHIGCHVEINGLYPWTVICCGNFSSLVIRPMAYTCESVIVVWIVSPFTRFTQA